MKVNAVALAQPELHYHCLQCDVGGWQVHVMKWEEKSEETSTEGGGELLPAGPFIL